MTLRIRAARLRDLLDEEERTPLPPSPVTVPQSEGLGSEDRTERLRVCFDTLMLMTTEDLKVALRDLGLPVSGLKMNQA